MLTTIWEEMAEIELGGSGSGSVYSDTRILYKAHIRKWDSSLLCSSFVYLGKEVRNHSVNCNTEVIIPTQSNTEIPRWKQLMMDAIQTL